MIGQADFVYVAVKNIKTTGEKLSFALFLGQSLIISDYSTTEAKKFYMQKIQFQNYRKNK